MRSTLLAGLTGVFAAFLGAICCIGPLLFITFGVGAGLAATFDPLRPFFGATMVAAFGLGFYSVYGRAAAPPVVDDAITAAACAVPRSRARERALLWTALAIALVLWTFPTWSVWLL